MQDQNSEFTGLTDEEIEAYRKTFEAFSAEENDYTFEWDNDIKHTPIENDFVVGELKIPILSDTLGDGELYTGALDKDYE